MASIKDMNRNCDNLFRDEVFPIMDESDFKQIYGINHPTNDVDEFHWGLDGVRVVFIQNGDKKTYHFQMCVLSRLMHTSIESVKFEYKGCFDDIKNNHKLFLNVLKNDYRIRQ